MSTSVNGYTTNKISRIQDDEKEILSQLNKIYANDYKRYFEYIILEPNVPESVKKIYKLLDERKAYRRISDYFHRKRRSKIPKGSQSNVFTRSYHRSSNRGFPQVPEPISVLQMNDEDDDNDPQQSNSSTMTDDESYELIPTNNDSQQIQPFSSIKSTHQEQRRSSLPKSSITTPTTQSVPNLLSVRANIQNALHELDRVIITKSDINDQEQHRLTDLLTNGHSHSKLDDIVRSLSNTVNQQQDNVRSIINESSTLLVDDNKHSEESIKHVLERLNTLVDRGHSIYDKIESVLSNLE